MVRVLLENGANIALVNEYNETAEASAVAAAAAAASKGGQQGQNCRRCAELIARYRASREAGDRSVQ